MALRDIGVGIQELGAGATPRGVELGRGWFANFNSRVKASQLWGWETLRYGVPILPICEERSLLPLSGQIYVRAPSILRFQSTALPFIIATHQLHDLWNPEVHCCPCQDRYMIVLHQYSACSQLHFPLFLPNANSMT